MRLLRRCTVLSHCDGWTRTSIEASFHRPPRSPAPTTLGVSGDLPMWRSWLGSWDESRIVLIAWVVLRAVASTEHGPAHRALVLPLEVIRHLPTFFFDHAYLHALASSSRWMLCRVRDKGNWLGLDVDVDQRDLQQPHRLRGMVDLLTMARNVCVNLHQLSMFIGVPANLKVNWAPVPLPYAALVPFMLFGFQSEQPLLGAAEFDLVLPAAVRRLVIGVNEWGGHKLTYCSVDNVFRRSITWSIGLDDRPPMPHASASRFSPLPDCASRFALRWNERSFIIALNGEGVSRARLRDDEEDTAPPLSTVFVWAFGRARHRVIRPEVSTLPSPVQADSPIRCCICDRVHMLMHRLMPLRWRVCPVCTTWVCASHARQTPFRRCPNCIMQLGDFLGGASHADLTEAIQDYVFYQRIELVGRQALRYVLMVFSLNYGHCIRRLSQCLRTTEPGFDF